MDVVFYTDEKIAETSSKGNQEKWLSGERWYKLDQFGYEALAETVSSCLLQRSNILSDTDYNFVQYRMERMRVHGRERVGCSSKNFLAPDQSIITLSHLLKRECSESLQKTLNRLSSLKKKIAYIAEYTAELTGLSKFPQYLTILFEIDALFLNDDRHLNNIAILEKDGNYDYCPIFDNGAGLLSNVQLSPMDIEPKALLHGLKARPFNTTFNRQVKAIRELYGRQLWIPRLTVGDILSVLREPLSYYAERDRGIITDRVCEVILARQKTLQIK